VTVVLVATVPCGWSLAAKLRCPVAVRVRGTSRVPVVCPYSLVIFYTNYNCRIIGIRKKGTRGEPPELTLLLKHLILTYLRLVWINVGLIKVVNIYEKLTYPGPEVDQV